MINHFARHCRILSTNCDVGLFKDSFLNLRCTLSRVLDWLVSLALFSDIAVACGAADADPIGVALGQDLAQLLDRDPLSKRAQQIHSYLMPLRHYKSRLQSVQLLVELILGLSEPRISFSLRIGLSCLGLRNPLPWREHHSGARGASHRAAALHLWHASWRWSESHLLIFVDFPPFNSFDRFISEIMINFKRVEMGIADKQ